MSFTREELLILLIEECGEVIQAATKCLRFGYDVDHGTGYGNNKLVLSRELGDMLGVVDGLEIDHDNLAAMRCTKLKRAADAKAKYGAARVEAAFTDLPDDKKINPLDRMLA